jgi:FkbM family methyltransferase
VLSLDADIRTNLGISGRYRLHLPAAASAVYLYGSLNDHRGERGAVRLARVLGKRSAAFVDVGAHLGLFLFHVTEAAPGIPIYYFEPSPSLFRRLEANVGRNHLPRVVGFQCAIGRSTGRARWFENISDSLSSSLTEMFRATHETVETDVDVISFGDFCRRRNLERLCVKVDIEGAEFEFLEGAGDELWRIDFLIMEVLGPAIAKGFVRACQEASGMEAYYINDFRLEHTRSGAFRYVESQYNWLFCRLPPTALKATLSDARLQVVSG